MRPNLSDINYKSAPIAIIALLILSVIGYFALLDTDVEIDAKDSKIGEVITSTIGVDEADKLSSLQKVEARQTANIQATKSLDDSKSSIQTLGFKTRDSGFGDTTTNSIALLSDLEQCINFPIKVSLNGYNCDSGCNDVGDCKSPWKESDAFDALLSGGDSGCILKGYDKSGYDKDGYNRLGYDKSGYDKSGYDRAGFDRDGYGKDGYNRAGFDKSGFDRDGFNRAGFDKSGFDRDGFNKSGYDRDGFNRDGCNAAGLNRDGVKCNPLSIFNTKGFDQDGYDREGYNGLGYDRDGFDREGFDQDGYDREGYNRDGCNAAGLNKQGVKCNPLSTFTPDGFDRDGYDREGYDKLGFDRDGYDKDGYNKDGYDKQGYDKDGYDKSGYDKIGFDRDGFDRDGYDRSGCNKAGYNRLGELCNTATSLDKEGYDQLGYDKDGYDREGFSSSTLDRQGFDKQGFDDAGFDRNGFDRDGFDRDGYDRNGYNKDGCNTSGLTVSGVVCNPDAEFQDDGFDLHGFDRDGYNKDKFDREGYDIKGLNQNGFDREGLDKFGLDIAGYDREGFNLSGCNKEGYNKSGNLCKQTSMFDSLTSCIDYDSEGYHCVSGLNSDGFDRNGFCKKSSCLYYGNDISRDCDENNLNKDGFSCTTGLNAMGYDIEGYNEIGLDKAGYDKRGYDIEGIAPDGHDKDGFTKEGFDKNGCDKGGFTKNGVSCSIKGSVSSQPSIDLSKFFNENDMVKLEAMIAQKVNFISSLRSGSEPALHGEVNLPVTAGFIKTKKSRVLRNRTVVALDSTSPTPTTTSQVSATAIPTIPALTVLFTILINDVNTDYPGPVMTRIISGPLSGAILRGDLSVPFSDNVAMPRDKIKITFSSIIFKGVTHELPSDSVFAVSPEKLSFYQNSSVNNHYISRYGGLLLSSFMQGFSEVFSSEDSTTTIINGYPIIKDAVEKTSKNARYKSLGIIAKDISESTIQYYNRPPTIKIKIGTELGVIFTQEVYNGNLPALFQE